MPGVTMGANIIQKSNRAKWILNCTGPIALANFFVYLIVNIYLGGDALNGFIRDQHYFLCRHGACVEVTKSIWKYSYWHAITALGGIILIFVEAAVLVNIGDIDLDFTKRV